MATTIDEFKLTFPDSTEQRVGLPPASIIIWSGPIIDIPAGWALCDGTNGTPDLRDRFIVGAGATYSVGVTGGSASVTLTTGNLPTHTHPASFSIDPDGRHSHTVGPTNTTGAHTHPGTALRQGGGGFGGTGGSLGLKPATTGSGGAHDHPASTNNTGSHEHGLDLSISSVGGGVAHNNLPRYYALAFIKEIA